MVQKEYGQRYFDDNGNIILEVENAVRAANVDVTRNGSVTPLQTVMDGMDDAQRVSHFSEETFRAYIPVFKTQDGKYGTDYDFTGNRIDGNSTAYVSPSGLDSNNGLTPSTPKKTINAAYALNVSTIILMAGTYTAGTHFTAGTELADINLIGIGGVTIDANGGAPIKVTGDFYAEDIAFINGNHGSLWTYTTNNADVLTFVRCKFNNSVRDTETVGSAQSLGGLRAQGGTLYLYQCEASSNGYDGLNYHSAPDSTAATAPHVAEVECYGYYNGMTSSYESCNGSTAHDGAQVLRLNCKYGCAHGGVVADVHSGTVSWNIGCDVFSPIELGSSKRTYQANYFCATSATMHLVGCKSNGGYYDISCFGSGTVYTDNGYNNNYSTGGTITIEQ